MANSPTADLGAQPSDAFTAAALQLSDGTQFVGEMTATGRIAAGEVVFNTVMSGYQEVISDPSYAGQIIVFTSAHIGNYGTCDEDLESLKPACAGVVVRSLARRPSNWRSTNTLADWLAAHDVPIIWGLDTRQLTRHLRTVGAIPGAFGPIGSDASSDGARALATAADSAQGTDGCDLTKVVTCTEPYTVEGGPRRIVAVDYGMKRTIVDQLAQIATVTVVPATTTADEILALNPQGVFLSNGPGDPAAVVGAPAQIQAILEAGVPTFGICMGHQLLCTALGARTFKLDFGHHGGNHPVKDLATDTIEITSQNHNYCVDIDGVPDIEATHINLNDGTLEGIRSTRFAAFGIQYHPEAGPGPHDSRYLFARFAELIDEVAAVPAG